MEFYCDRNLRWILKFDNFLSCGEASFCKQQYIQILLVALMTHFIVKRIEILHDKPLTDLIYHFRDFFFHAVFDFSCLVELRHTSSVVNRKSSNNPPFTQPKSQIKKISFLILFFFYLSSDKFRVLISCTIVTLLRLMVCYM